MSKKGNRVLTLAFVLFVFYSLYDALTTPQKDKENLMNNDNSTTTTIATADNNGNLPQIFKHQEFGQVRVIMDGRSGEPWFVAADVAKALDYRDAEKLTRLLDEDEKGTLLVGTPGGKQSMTTISEAGLYAGILRSDKPEAKQFRRWITHEVLPALRQHGMFAAPQTLDAMLSDPDTAIKMLTAFKREQEARKKVEAKLAVAAPKAVLVDVAFAKRSKQAVPLQELGRKFLGLNINRLGRDLYDAGIFYRRNDAYRVYAKYRDSYFLERWNPATGKQAIYATSDGAALVAKLYKEGKLTMRIGYTRRTAIAAA